MGKRNSGDWNENKLNRFLQEGRGKGVGADYKPWLTIQDFPTLGKATRIKGSITKRQHNFFTDSQLKYFFLLEWENGRVLDVREHFPLLNVQDVIQKKSDLNFKLFEDKESHVPYIISTTFLITVRKLNGEIVNVARSIKGASELQSKKSTLEKLEIERRYWEEKSINFGIVTNKDINTVRSKNIEWIHPALVAEDYNGFSKNDLMELSQGLIQRFDNNHQSIRKVLHQYETDYSLDAGTGIFLFKYLIANKRVNINIDEPININLGSNLLNISENNSEEDKRSNADFC